jgi:Bacterial Alpha-2-macroglobulin MG10 domain/Alpha-2-macroglobulin family/MG2 domain
MKRIFPSILLAMVFLGICVNPGRGASRDDAWKKVDEAIKKGLPKTAIETLDPIIQAALGEKAYAEAAKAIAQKIALEGAIEGNKPEEKITRLEKAIAQAPQEIVPLLDTILADWYWRYFQQNRWRFMRRTATAEAPGPDFTTWDLPRLFAEIDKVFSRALARSDELKRTPVAAFDMVLEKGTAPDRYRPTLYDFIAQEALEFYTSGEQAGAKPEDAYELASGGPVFEPVDSFMNWKVGQGTPPGSETNSPVFKAVRLYQELLAFHRNDPDRSAFLDVDLARLVYGNNTAVGEDKTTRYAAALDRFANQHADHEIAARALHHWAQIVQGQGDLVRARQLALRGLEAHRDSVGGRMCFNLIQSIEAKTVRVATEQVWNAPWPNISVRYRNITNLYFRVVAWDWTDFLEKKHNRPDRLNAEERQELLARPPVLAWSVPLPPTVDYKERLQQVPAPTKLKKGFYFLVASHDPAFGDQDNQVSYTDLWVSDLALVVRTRAGNLDGFVLNALSGEPVAKAEVKSWYLDNNGNRVSVPAVASDELGFFNIDPPTERRRGFVLLARTAGDEISSERDYWVNQPRQAEPYSQTIFFTDRALYRPGQTIRYKGVCLRVDTEKNDYHLLPGRQVKILFADPNRKEVARQTSRCNDYGSFSGSFTAPAGRLTGRYMISVDGEPRGNVSFNVEEYKRPKFQVTLDPPKTSPKLEDKVDVVGRAESYTGAAIDGALVKWRVVRQIQFPWWCWWGWRSLGGRNASQEIAHGAVRTGTDGGFHVEFMARPDRSISPTNEPTFTFTVYADVTDTAGETRSAQRSVRVGYTALEVSMTADNWQAETEPVQIKLGTTTLDGEPQTAEGQVKVYQLKPPAAMQRPPLSGAWPAEDNDGSEEDVNPSDPNTWPLGELVAAQPFTTDGEGKAKLDFKLARGPYRALLETQDRFGKKVSARLSLQVLKPDDAKLGIPIPQVLAAPKWTLEPGEELMALWGTGYAEGRAFIEIEHRSRMIQRYWTKPGQTQQQIKQAVTEAMRGGFYVHVTQVRENRGYLTTHYINVPWSNKELELKWEHFVSKLEPAQKETWTLAIQPKELSSTTNLESRVAAELVAALYDESLDQFQPHHWLRRFGFFYRDYTSSQGRFQNSWQTFRHLQGNWKRDTRDATWTYRSFPRDLVANVWSYQWARNLRFGAGLGGADHVDYDVAVDALSSAAATPLSVNAPASVNLFFKQEGLVAAGAMADRPAHLGEGLLGEPAERANAPDLSQVSARKNLNETAFFFPHLISDAHGVVKLEFTMPEALTKWRFLGFAYDRQLRSGFLEDHAVTSKDLMVQPNPPRFLREGDEIEFAVKVSNLSAARQTGRVKLSFTFVSDGSSADAALGNARNEQAFDVPSKESRSYSWRLRVPDGCGFLTYKTVASTGRLSDGEEGYLPVLSRRIFVTESLPLPIRGPATNTFQFDRLLQSASSKTLENRSLVVQMVSNPAWYAVLALPYLMEYPHECSEQVFNRLYANALARNIAQSDPKIRRIFDQWKNTPALESPLEKNQDLKAVLLEETPWLRQAKNESEARHNVGVLFDDNRLEDETSRTLRKLAEMQLNDGSWPWFPGGRGNDFITLYITTGFGRLRHLGVDINVDPALKSLARLDNWMDEHYRRILQRPKPNEYVPSSTDALYLYGRSFFLKDRPIAPNHTKAVEFFLARSRDHWLKVDNRQSQGHLALALKRFDAVTAVKDSTPSDIMKSIKERSVTNEEMGMFWRDTEMSWWWYRAPIETQALMIEAFDEVMGDQQAVEECRVWLLKQKQTQDWKSTKATADAVYALLLRGKDILAGTALVDVELGGTSVSPFPSPSPRGEGRGEGKPRVPQPPAVEPGTGFYEYRFPAADIKPALGRVTVKKVDAGVAWGSVNWQYFEDISKVTPHEGTPLKLKKSLYTKVNTKQGPVLEPVKGPLQVGDELVVRLELRVDRDMEYVHLKDQRGSGTEPVNVLSRYHYQDGLAYYESTRDTASHFFIDYLPKGVYVFEYSTRVQLRGQYQTGIAEIQCMYAPEFNSHSESLLLVVQ